MTSTTARGAILAATTALLVTGATGPGFATKAGGGSNTGTGTVFMVNPVQSSGVQTLADDDDSATSVPASQYAAVQLRHLDGSGYLRGDYVTVASSTGTPAYSTSNTFDATALARDGQAAADVVRTAFAARGITVS